MNSDYLEIPIGQYCSKNCLFCSEGGRGNRAIMSLEDFVKLMNNIDKNKIAKVIFSAGEPILNPKLFDYIKACNEKGIKSGVVTAWEFGFGEKFCEKLANSGLSEIMFSIEGIGKIHDFLVQKEGAFFEIIKALLNFKKVKKKGLDVIIHININKINYKIIPKLLKFLQKNFPFISKYYLQVLEPIGKAKLNYDILMKKYSDFLPYIFENILILNNEIKNKIEIGILPYCVVPEEFHKTLGRHINIYDGNLSANDLIIDNHYNNLKFYNKKCFNCKKYKTCNLFFTYYIKKYGDSEIKPYL